MADLEVIAAGPRGAQERLRLKLGWAEVLKGSNEEVPTEGQRAARAYWRPRKQQLSWTKVNPGAASVQGISTGPV